MSQETHNVNINHVRKVLMHDLEMSRDNVRQIMKDVITEIVEGHIKGGAIEHLVEKQVQAAIKGTRRDSLEHIMKQRVDDAVRQQIANPIERIVTDVKNEVKMMIVESITKSL